MKFIEKKNVNLAELVFDLTIYPRHTVSPVMVNEYVDAVRNGAEFPLIKVDMVSMRIIDGFHRVKCYEKLKMTAIGAEFYQFKDDAELLEYAIRWNANHGYRFTKLDQARCIILGEQFGMTNEVISAALGITPERYKEIVKDRIREVSPVTYLKGGKKEKLFEPVKRILSAVTDKKVTQEQLNAQKSMGALHAAYYIDQASLILETDLLKLSELNIERVKRLYAATQTWVKGHKKVA